MDKKKADPLKVVNSGFSGTMTLEESKRLVEELKEKKREREHKS